MKRTVVSAATTSTTNITGFFTISLGSSFLKDLPMAGIRIFGSVIVAVTDRFDLCAGDMDFGPRSSESFTAKDDDHRQMLDDRPNASAGKKVRPPTIKITPATSSTNCIP